MTGQRSHIQVRPALPRDVPAIHGLVEPYAVRRILLAKDRVAYYEAVQEFVVAETVPGQDGPSTQPLAAVTELSGVQPPPSTQPAGAPSVGGASTLDPPRSGASGPSHPDVWAVPDGPWPQPSGGRLVGCGALHVLWSDLAEVRTLAVAEDHRRTGLGHRLLTTLLDRARRLGLSRVFCLTFEVEFFSSHGFVPIDGTVVVPEVYAEMLRSNDDGVAEFLDLAQVKENTLGNTRMLLTL